MLLPQTHFVKKEIEEINQKIYKITKKRKKEKIFKSTKMLAFSYHIHSYRYNVIMYNFAHCLYVLFLKCSSAKVLYSITSVYVPGET